MSAGRELILLVGGNPLPNYVTARALHQRGLIDRVRLLFTREVEPTKNHLRQCLAPIPLSPDVQVDPADAHEIQSACGSILGLGEAHLDYTGGTNAMAVHVHADSGRRWIDLTGIRPSCQRGAV